MAQLADALDAAHARGLIHRDVKPSNALVADPDEHVYLADFGLTRHASARARPGRGEELVGTVDYVAPEQIRGGQIDGRADLYALGCVLYECLTGQRPFVRRSEAAVLYAHLEDKPPRASEHCRTVPRALDVVIARALAKDPGERWQTGAEFVGAARAAVSGEASRARGRSRRVALIAAAGAIAAGLAAGAYAVLTGDGSRAVSVAPNSVAVIDPARDAVVAQLSVGARPGDITVGAGRVWVDNLDDNLVSEINPRTGTVGHVLDRNEHRRLDGRGRRVVGDGRTRRRGRTDRSDVRRRRQARSGRAAGPDLGHDAEPDRGRRGLGLGGQCPGGGGPGPSARGHPAATGGRRERTHSDRRRRRRDVGR
jgi:hypothetical protein